MSLFKTSNDLLINPYYIKMIGPILYNNTTEKYYYIIYLHGDDITNVNLSFNTEEEAAYERNQLVGHMRT